MTVKHEVAGPDISYEYQPMSIQRSTVTNDLDQKLNLTIADVDDELIKSVVSARLGANWKVRPSVKWRLYRDDDLTAPMVSLQTLEVATLSKDGSGNCTFDAQAPELNSVKTGEIYSLEIPTVAGHDMNLDHLHSRVWTKDYTCNEFLCEAWKEVTGRDLKSA